MRHEPGAEPALEVVSLGVGGTDDGAVEALGVSPDMRTHARVVRRPPSLVTAVVTDALDGVPAGTRAAVPLLGAVGSYCTAAAARYLSRCANPDVRLRPSDSLGLEAGQLLRDVATDLRWKGDCFLFADPVHSARQTLHTAELLLRSDTSPGHVLVVDLLSAEGGGQGAVSHAVVAAAVRLTGGHGTSAHAREQLPRRPAHWQSAVMQEIGEKTTYGSICLGLARRGAERGRV